MRMLIDYWPTQEEEEEVVLEGSVDCFHGFGGHAATSLLEGPF